MSAERLKAAAVLKAEAPKAGKTVDKWLQEDVRPILEKAWEIQQRTGKPVKLDDLMRELEQP